MDKNKQNNTGAGRPSLYNDPVDVSFRIERAHLEMVQALYPEETKSRALALFIASVFEPAED